MKFDEVVELVETVESALGSLNEGQLDLFEAMVLEGADTKFDFVHHLDYLVDFVSSYSEENALTIAESADCGEVLSRVLDASRMYSSNNGKFLSEAIRQVGEIDVDGYDEDSSSSVTLLSVVTSKLTEMLGESEVEAMPAEMIFDIVNETKYLDISDDAEDMELPELVNEISDALEEAIRDGSIDFDTEDYVGETLAEFLDDYEDTDDLLEEMTKVTGRILAEASDEDGARLMKKAKEATMLLEGKLGRCPDGDLKCQNKKAKLAKEWFDDFDNADEWHSRHKHMGNSADITTWQKHDGKLGAAVKAARKSFKQRYGKDQSPIYTQYVLVPGIIKRMRAKNKHMSKKAGMKKKGMR